MGRSEPGRGPPLWALAVAVAVAEFHHWNHWNHWKFSLLSFCLQSSLGRHFDGGGKRFPLACVNWHTQNAPTFTTWRGKRELISRVESGPLKNNVHSKGIGQTHSFCPLISQLNWTIIITDHSSRKSSSQAMTLSIKELLCFWVEKVWTFHWSAFSEINLSLKLHHYKWSSFEKV